MKPSRTRFVFKLLTFVSLAFLLPITATAKDENKLPEVSSDGLHLVKDTKAEIVYVKPGATLETYTKVKILDCYVQFKKNWQRDYNMNELGLDGRVTNKEAEEIKQRVAVGFKKEFTKVLNEEGHEVVEDTGPDVLLLRPAIINLDVTEPDIMRAGMETSFVQSAGEMTLYMEMYDSATSTLLARVVDAQADDRAFGMQANRVTNTAAADLIFTYWAKELSKHLGSVKETAKSK